MKTLLLTCLIITAIGCKKAHTLTMADLKLPDFEKEFIAKSKVDTIYHVADKIYFGNQDSDTLEYEVFDNNGNRLCVVGIGRSIRNKYDSLGFKTEEIFSTDASSHSYIQYRLIADSLKLYEDWYYFDKDNKKHFFTPLYYVFDSAYKVVKCVRYTKESHFKPSEEFFKYDSIGRLINISGQVISGHRNLQYEKNIYYTGNKPDSVIVKHTGDGEYTTKTYYNSLGLKDKEVYDDTIITHFKYIFRK